MNMTVCVCVLWGKKKNIPAETEHDEDRQKVFSGELGTEERKMERKGFVTKRWLWLVCGARAERHNDALVWL